MQENELSAACAQLLSKEDLEIDEQILKKLELKDTYTEIKSHPAPQIKIYSKTKLILSDIIPIIHNFNFQVLDEISYEITANGMGVYINRFNLKVKSKDKLESHKKNIKDIITSVIDGTVKYKGKLYELVYLENFCQRSIMLFRALINYEDQMVSAFNSAAIVFTLVKFSNISKFFLEYFMVKFDPSVKGKEQKIKADEKKIIDALKEVKNINEDKILKLFFEILKNILRTNYFLNKESIAFKVNTKNLKPFLKGIQPNIEAFVFNQDFNGLHLRVGNISRGGIRWSDRYDDYRNEVRSLMIAQEGKNAVIIPQGAKGGFVIYKDKSHLSKEEFKKCYISFIDALLDLVDNIKKGKIQKNKNIVAYDGDDPYFVVAADKGTSQMSDVANEISKQRGFWLKDAFASGGSKGYHHKKLGITAKGAIKSAQRFFIEKGVDFYKEPITVVGIGSLRGDVFGNGILQSKNFKLVAAISHSEIFIDPNPDIEKAYKERVRVFNLPDPKWSNYDKSIISKGGGVFKRSEKEIELNDELKKFLKTSKKFLNGEELAKKLLMLPVDMIYNGGVGTYFKGSEESNIEVGDKENEAVRVDASDIKAFCICEGGNLGLTQKARVEYAKNGGKINLDSIDNSAGVDTSDHEVNLKILLNTLVEKNILKEEEKDENLKSLEEFVVSNVLWTNYFQSLSISLDEERSKKDIKAFVDTIEVLEENLDFFRRRDFNLPKNTSIQSILTQNGTIIRPALAILTLYAKIVLKNILNRSDMVATDANFEKYLFKYFPKPFVSVYEDEIKKHPLKKEIISTIIANKIINFCGSSFIADLGKIGEERFLLKIKAYLISNELFGANDVRYEIYRRDYEVEPKNQYELLLEIEEAIKYNMNWMLKSLSKDEISFEGILGYQSSIKKILSELEIEKKCFIQKCDLVNSFFATIDYLKLSTAIINIKKTTKFNFGEIAAVFYYIIDKLEIATIMDAVEESIPKDEIEKLLKEQQQKLIEFLIVDITKKILNFKRKLEHPRDAVENYLKEKCMDVKEYEAMIEKIRSQEDTSVPYLSSIINYLLIVPNGRV
jgi:glutamate dehydrogenase